MRLSLILAFVSCALAPTAAYAAAQGRTLVPASLITPRLQIDSVTRIFDPKLDGALASFEFHLDQVGAQADALVEIKRSGVVLATVWNGQVRGGAAPTQVTWNGRDAQGVRCDTGSYELAVSAPGCRSTTRAFDIVRLGVTEIEAQDSPGANDEFQMVYFMKGAGYAFYGTPAIGEYKNVAPPTGGSELDLNNGEPRPAVAVHDDLDEPVLNGANFNTTTHNYPLAYIRGSRPRLEFRFGASGTSTAGGAMDVGYPVAGFELRLECDTGEALAGSDLVTPGGVAVIDLPPLPAEVRRLDTSLTLRFEYRHIGANGWRPVPGSLTIPLRFYTLLDTPRFKAGSTGVQHSGPWVEVAQYVASWSTTLGIPITDQASLTEVFVKGFFGQNGGIPTAIEGVRYDAPPLGGANGSTHYFQFSGWRMNLSRLLNAHASGVYVNCSDNMGATTTMLSMMGAQNVRPVRIGAMNLLAIWGIGAPDYTLNLWGSGSHGFSYHHIVTDDAGVNVSDTCMQLDADGVPNALPGAPGWNVLRPWLGANGYRALSCSNAPNITVEALPGLL